MIGKDFYGQNSTIERTLVYIDKETKAIKRGIVCQQGYCQKRCAQSACAAPRGRRGRR